VLTTDTSKYGSVGKHGYRGEALNAIGVCSTLDIMSKTECSSQTWASKIHKGTHLGVYKGSDGNIDFECGTTVKVSNLFINLPVRRKLALSVSKTDTIQLLKRLILAPLVLAPNVTISVWSGNKRILFVPPNRRQQVPRAIQVLEMLYGKGCVVEWEGIGSPSDGQTVEGVVGSWSGPARACPRVITVKTQISDDVVTHRKVQTQLHDGQFYIIKVNSVDNRASSVRKLIMLAITAAPHCGDASRPKRRTAPRRRAVKGLEPDEREILSNLPTAMLSGHFSRQDELSRDDLGVCKVISQFNYEFVLVRFDREPPLLGILDPHAADERIRYENALSDLCARPVEHVPLCEPISFSVPDSDVVLLAEHRSAIEEWGVRFQVDSTIVTVHCLPQSLLDSSRGDLAAIATKLIVQHARDLRDGRIPTDAGLQRLHTTVPAILRSTLGTTACHTAIRFGDCVSSDTANQLVNDLSLCRRPFECVHGRPSIVPLVALGPRPTPMPHSEGANAQLQSSNGTIPHTHV
jgi:DNA mismatch repair ATPase MutL